jgi:hypothetical protein
MLFDRAKLAEDEREQAAGLGLEIVEEGGAWWLRQPCPAFRGAACAVYAGRPNACRSYRCLLLKAVEAGKTSLDDGLALVAKAKAQIAEQARSGPLGTVGERRRRRRLGPDGASVQAEEVARARKLYVETVALDLFLTKHFRGERKETLFADAGPVTGAGPRPDQRDA